MTKNEMAILLYANAGEVREIGNFSYFGFLLECGYAEQYGPGIDEFCICSAEQVKFIKHIVKSKKARSLWESGESDVPDDDYDTIEAGLEIYEEFNEVLADNQYYRFTDDSGDIFESHDAAESEAYSRMMDAGFQDIKPFLAHSKDELEELCETFGLDHDDFLEIENTDEILEELESQINMLK